VAQLVISPLPKRYDLFSKARVQRPCAQNNRSIGTGNRFRSPPYYRTLLALLFCFFFLRYHCAAFIETLKDKGHIIMVLPAALFPETTRELRMGGRYQKTEKRDSCVFVALLPGLTAKLLCGKRELYALSSVSKLSM
jgi:hypothetical protein